MIDTKLVENIENYGICKGTGEERRKLLVDDIGLRIGEKAEYVIITGCFPPEGMPHVFGAFKGLLDHFQIDYTLLSKEYCCGWMPQVVSYGRKQALTLDKLGSSTTSCTTARRVTARVVLSLSGTTRKRETSLFVPSV